MGFAAGLFGKTGILSKVSSFLGPIGQAVSIGTGLMGMMGGKKGGGGAAPAAKPVEPTSTVQDEEEQRRKRLLALNAGANNGQLTAAGGDTSMASIGRKTLLGQ